MRRRAFFSCLAGFAPPLPAADPCPVRVEVGDRAQAIAVTIPNFAKWQLVGIVSDFLGRGNPAATAAMNKLLPTAKDLTLIVTTKCSEAK